MLDPTPGSLDANLAQGGVTKNQFVYQVLRASILNGRLRPGEELKQTEIARRLDVTRTPVRQAIARLHSEKLVEMRDHRTATVTPLNPDDIDDIYTARVVMEGVLAESAALRAGRAVVITLQEKNSELARRVAAGDLAHYVELDREIHRLLHEASGYRLCSAVAEELRDAADRYVRLFASTQGRAEKSVAEHFALIDAVGERRPELARKLAEAHVREGQIALTKQMIKNHQLVDSKRMQLNSTVELLSPTAKHR